MKLNIKKLTLFAFLCAIGAGSIPQSMRAAASASSELTQQQYDDLHELNNEIRLITDLAKFLVSKIENKQDPDALDVIVRKMQSLEPSVIALRDKIKLKLDCSETTEGIFYKALEIKYEIIEKIHSTLNRLAEILEKGLKGSVPKKEISPVAFMFWNQIKQPLSQLAAPDELNYFESKLSALHSLIEEINSENTSMIKELLFLLHKIREITESNGKASYSAVSRKLPKKRAPFAGIPIPRLEDWIGEMQGNR